LLVVDIFENLSNNALNDIVIKLEIDFEVEQHKREGLVFDWKCSMYFANN
jgi:hypothetical protein